VVIMLRRLPVMRVTHVTRAMLMLLCVYHQYVGLALVKYPSACVVIMLTRLPVMRVTHVTREMLMLLCVHHHQIVGLVLVK